MKINEVEQLVGITKKNIRFYEEEGLISPGRNKTNGYREYSQDDVETLMRIRLLRQLSVPLEEIRRVQEGKMTLAGCLDRHEITMNHQIRNLELGKEMCRKLAEESIALCELNAEQYLKEMEELERGGNRFMDVKKTDVKKRRAGAVISAVVMIGAMLLWDIFILVMSMEEPLPWPLAVFLIGLPTLVIIGIVIALYERLKELKGGEIYEAGNY